MVPRGGVEPSTLRFSVGERRRNIRGQPSPIWKKQAVFALWMAKPYPADNRRDDRRTQVVVLPNRRRRCYRRDRAPLYRPAVGVLLQPGIEAVGEGTRRSASGTRASSRGRAASCSTLSCAPWGTPTSTIARKSIGCSLNAALSTSPHPRSADPTSPFSKTSIAGWRASR